MKRRNKFSLSNDRLFSCNAGALIPFGLTEVLPGDTIQHATSLFCRVTPLVAPVMHPVHVKIHHWFVPFRLLFSEWESFITGGEDGLDVTEFPYMQGAPETGSLLDYLGIPPTINPELKYSALPVRAYNLIYNEWYRSTLLQGDVTLSKESGLDETTTRELLLGDWEKDYFTTATPDTQLGPLITVPVDINSAGLPISGTMPVTTAVTGQALSLLTDNSFGGTNPLFFDPEGDGTGPMAGTLHNGTAPDNVSTTGLRFIGGQPIGTASADGNLSITPGADLGSISIDSLREAFALQRFAEHRNLYGSRYVEYLRYLGVRSSDARLQRPEYLGGGRQTIQFSEVLQTAEGTDPVGTLRGHGIAAMRSNRYRRFFEEHGYVMSLLQIIPKAIYAQGVPRHWLRTVKEDFYQKELESIGEQEVYNAELYAPSTTPMEPFGYQARYQEYRGQESSVAGEFRDLLSYWHMARIFSNQPVLNEDFVAANPTNRIFASSDTDQFYVMAHHSIQARRMVTNSQSARF